MASVSSAPKAAPISVHRAVRMSVVRYSAPGITGAAAASVAMSSGGGGSSTCRWYGNPGRVSMPSRDGPRRAKLGGSPRDSSRSGRAQSAVTKRPANSRQYAKTGGTICPTSAAPRRKSPCPGPRAKARRTRSPRPGSSAGASSDGESSSRPCGVRQRIRRRSGKTAVAFGKVRGWPRMIPGQTRSRTSFSFIAGFDNGNCHVGPHPPSWSRQVLMVSGVSR